MLAPQSRTFVPPHHLPCPSTLPTSSQVCSAGSKRTMGEAVHGVKTTAKITRSLPSCLGDLRSLWVEAVQGIHTRIRQHMSLGCFHILFTQSSDHAIQPINPKGRPYADPPEDFGRNPIFSLNWMSSCAQNPNTFADLQGSQS